MSLFNDRVSGEANSSKVSTAMEIWASHLPSEIPKESIFLWRTMIVEFACDQWISKSSPFNRQPHPANAELQLAVRKIVGSLNLFDQAQLVISL